MDVTRSPAARTDITAVATITSAMVNPAWLRWSSVKVFIRRRFLHLNSHGEFHFHYCHYSHRSRYSHRSSYFHYSRYSDYSRFRAHLPLVHLPQYLQAEARNPPDQDQAPRHPDLALDHQDRALRHPDLAQDLLDQDLGARDLK